MNDTLNYVQAVQEVQLPTVIEQKLELAEINDNFHPFLVEDLRLCVLAKSMKECSVFTKSKVFKVPKKNYPCFPPKTEKGRNRQGHLKIH